MTIDNYENVVVTGASSGIGEAVARDLSQAGLNVHAIARRTERLEELAANTNRLTQLSIEATNMFKKPLTFTSLDIIGSLIDLGTDPNAA